MTLHDIPIEVRQLLREHVESYEQLEVLLRFAGTQDRSWSPDEIAAKAGVSPELAGDALAHLSRAGVLAQSDSGATTRFSPHADHAGTIDRLGEIHQRDRLGIMNLMTSHALERVRTSALRAFTGAFLLGKKRDG